MESLWRWTSRQRGERGALSPKAGQPLSLPDFQGDAAPMFNAAITVLEQISILKRRGMRTCLCKGPGHRPPNPEDDL